MKNKNIIITIAIIIALVAVMWFVMGGAKGEPEGHFQLEAVQRGNLENLVSCTGTLSAVGTVSVGSQVSGLVVKVNADYNSPVKEGQMLAVLDKTLFAASVKDAESGLTRARAQYNQAQAELKRNRPLFERGHLSEMEFLVTQTNAETAAAAIKSAEATLSRAQTQLKYTDILSPIDGTVIERTVEPGQTIAASFQAPKLFVIAKDLTKMQIETAVDESDIGQIKEEQSVRFTVQAYPDETFTGKVRQIRLNPTVVQNVVNYTVVVDALNEKKLLLPGMTATVDFLVEERKNVLLVSNAALNFIPPAEVIDKYKLEMSETMKERLEGRVKQEQVANGRGGQGGLVGKKSTMNSGRVFYLDKNGVPTIAFFEKGASDGNMTEILRSADLREGLQVITAYVSADKIKAKEKGFALPRPGGSGKSGTQQGPPPGL